jgi:hypothetical protein
MMNGWPGKSAESPPVAALIEKRKKPVVFAF